MKQKTALQSMRAWALGACSLALLACPTMASAEVLALATDQPGTTFGAIGTAMAATISKHSKSMRVIVRPFAGPTAFMPLLDSGEIKLAVLSANGAHESFTGENETNTLQNNFRILRSGSGSMMPGVLVRADSNIHSYADLRGKRFTAEFGGHLSIKNSLKATLEVGGLTWDDVTPVPVVSANDGIEALVAGRVDATWASLGQPAAREANTQIGVRYISAPNTPEAMAIFQRELFPGVSLALADEGSSPGLEGDVYLLSYDAYVIAHKNLDDETATKILAALWEGSEDLWPLHRSLEGFTREAAVASIPVAPYHPAAITFYKEKGLWTEENAALQAELMKGAD